MAPKVLTKPVDPVVEAQIEGQCVHYWIIAPASGPKSKGVCRECGAEKEFDNFLPLDEEWK